jgi:predicted permease
MPPLIHVLLARIRGAFREDALDRDLDQELTTHLAMAEADKMRRGMTRKEARRVARVELGGVTQLREASRAARGLPWLGSCWLDVKLGLRMLRKSWGLTLVGGVAMTVVIAVAAGAFSFFDSILGGRLPLDDGDRVVALMNWNAGTNRRQSPSLRDFDRWRDELRSVEHVGAFRTVERSLVAGNGQAELVALAEMTATGFEMARVAPLLGRPLLEEDEQRGAQPVLVVGYDVWRTRFSSDPTVVGQAVRLGATDHTVVGVMPEGFAFPSNHRFWTPLRANVSNSAPREDPAVFAFGRLAPGVTLEGAEAELTTLGLLPPVAVVDTSERLHPRVVPYTLGLVSTGEGNERLMAGFVLLIVTLLLVPPCANIAILVYARTVSRQEEFSARYALGAGRGRIVGQIFIEVLVLAAGAAGVALVLVRFVGKYVQSLSAAGLSGGLPFWVEFGDISVGTMLFAAGLAAFAALIAGAVPAFQATGRLMQSGLRALGSLGGMRLGATWTALVVGQVAFSMAVLPVATEMAWGILRPSILGPGFAAEHFVTAWLEVDPDQPTGPGSAVDVDQRPFATRFADLQDELARRLATESGVSGLTVSAVVPGTEPWAIVEIDGVNGLQPLDGGPIDDSDIGVDFNRVDDQFFDVFDVSLLAGRRFGAGDFEPGRDAVIINRTFAQQIIGDGPPLGRRIRYRRTAAGPSESSAWYEIVGVVDDLPANTFRRRVYHPMAPGQVHPVSLALRLGPTAPRATARILTIATTVDPTLRISEISPIDEVYRKVEQGNNLAAYLLGLVTLSVLLLSAAGMYALMSFTVARRRREIGIRSALGAQPRRLLADIFKRSMAQVTVGAGVGVAVASLLGDYLPIEEMGGWNIPGVLPGAATLIMVIGLLAVFGPARRGLRIEPSEALRNG